MSDSISSLFNKPDVGLLLLRLSAGAFVFYAGVEKFLGGAARLAETGKAMGYLGIDQFPVVWGFLAASAEVFGGLLFIIGLLFRFASLSLFGVMVVASVFVFRTNGADIMKAGFPLILAAIFLSFIFIGPGSYSAESSGGASSGKSSGKSSARKSYSD